MATFESVVLDVKKLTQQEIVKEAKRAHAEVMRAPPKPTGFVRHVDGVEAAEEAVKPFGIIVYDYRRLDLVKKLALEVLQELSPLKSGDYRNAHRVVKDTETEVWITNSIAYSRVIELSKRGDTVLRIQKGGHVYEKAMRRLNAMPDVANSVQVRVTFAETAGAAASRSRGDIKLAQWPTLIITAR